MTKASQDISKSTIIFSIITLLIVFLSIYFTINIAVKPLNIASKHLELISKGDFTKQVDENILKYNDKILLFLLIKIYYKINASQFYSDYQTYI